MFTVIQDGAKFRLGCYFLLIFIIFQIKQFFKIFSYYPCKTDYDKQNNKKRKNFHYGFR